MVHGKFLGSPHLVAPDADEELRPTFLAFMYFWIAELERRFPAAGRSAEPRRFPPACVPARLPSAGPVASVIGDKVDLAPVDAAFGIDLVEISPPRTCRSHHRKKRARYRA